MSAVAVGTAAFELFALAVVPHWRRRSVRVRRVAALAITMALAWLLVARLGSEPAGSAALALGVALIAASIVGWLFAFLRLPRVTGYLAFGLLCGPLVANIITEPMARDLSAASGFAIAVIAFIAGLQLQVRHVQPVARRDGDRSASSRWRSRGSGLAIVLFVAWPWLPIGPALAGWERAAAVALTATVLMGVSPTVTVAVIAESRARGPLSTMAATIVVLIELLVILVFAISLDGARRVFNPALVDGWTLAAATAWTLLGSLSFGAILGSLFALYVRYVGREITVVLLALCAIVAGLGARLHFEPLLAGVAAGLVVRNVLREAGDVLRDEVQRGAMPVFVLFFAAVGASMHVEALATIGVTAIVIAGLRAVLLRAGGRAGAARAGLESPRIAPGLARAGVHVGHHPRPGGGGGRRVSRVGRPAADA